jgi:beta-N-acetylhexosaminidase
MSLRELRRHVGRLAIVGFAGHTVPADLRRLAAEFDLGGVIYFARNVAEPAQVADLSREVAGLARHWPFWVSVDQEGGRVARLTAPFTEWPPASTLGRSRDETLAGRFAEALAAELRAVGINLDYAPVLDIHTNPANPVIGDRALGESAGDVARLGAVVIEGLQRVGVAACGKHFPGHGDTSVDSHESLPVIEHPPDRIEAVELAPFRRAVAARVATIMTAHVLVRALDEDRPASLSPRIVDGMLKTMLGFDGVVISDDLGMKAISASTSLPDAAIEAIAAGCDVVLLCNSTADEQATALEAMIRAVEDGRVSRPRVEDAMRRQHDVKARFPMAPSDDAAALDVVGCDAHRRVARDMARWL